MRTRLQSTMCLAGVILALGVRPAEATFSGFNGSIVFNAGDMFEEEIYRVTPDGQNLVQLTDTEGSNRYPAWSPDGFKIAFTSTRNSGRVTTSELYVMNADGSDAQRLTFDGGVGEASWAPGGTKIVYSRTSNDNEDLYVTNADGSGAPARITTHPWRDRDPSWSPDGSRIAFTRDDPDTIEDPYAIYQVNPDGNNEMKLTQSGFDEGHLDWSPSGHRIAFTRYLPVGGQVRGEIYVVGTDGLGLARLTYSDHEELNPVWSPDGSMIAYQRNSRFIHVMKNDGSNTTQLPTVPGSEFNQDPAWQPTFDWVKCAEENSRKKVHEALSKVVADHRGLKEIVDRLEAAGSGGINTVTDAVPESLASDVHSVTGPAAKDSGATTIVARLC